MFKFWNTDNTYRRSRLQSLLILAVLLCCVPPFATADNGQLASTLQQLYPNRVYNIGIIDPSGLTIDRSGEFLWIVSDERGDGVYAVSFEGETLAKLAYQGHDLEGITQNPDDGSLWVIEERHRQLVNIDRTGQELSRHDIDVPVTELNTGLEGIAYNPATGGFFIANKNLPRWILETDTYGKIQRRIQADFPRPFHIIDMSGLWYDAQREELWILSGTSAKLIVVDSNYRVLRGYQLDRVKYEGIAIDHDRGKLYLVNDLENLMYVFQLPNS